MRIYPTFIGFGPGYVWIKCHGCGKRFLLYHQDFFLLHTHTFSYLVSCFYELPKHNNCGYLRGRMENLFVFRTLCA